MKNEDMAASALIISEITGSITIKERKVLNRLRSSYPEVAALSVFMHKVLDPDIESIKHVKTTASKIIEMGNARQTTKPSQWIERTWMSFDNRKS